MCSVKFQLVSDLHLETPQARPTYEDFKIQPECQYLALLGDIGNIWDPLLFSFLEDQLRKFEMVFYLLGNHEAYGTTVLGARTTARAFEHETSGEYEFWECWCSGNTTGHITGHVIGSRACGLLP
ncbi:hypothetical protein NA56DRAFT_649836 [Hyaloscypha hepaticicola]|uniref:Uncharacterized protein n=1 Tax=Hyaloscypha hepaticicola TaxID=2082293 RepID=A0A2J6PPR0_9HELO|nr:hypothetical protein NA56DRAFT_649836 [Hyaloscypha hepaticicola]